jgi:hypothetical protein
MSAGAFFQIDQFLVDGMVPCEMLPGSGRWKHDPRTNTLSSPGRVIGAGDRFIVKITKVDMPRRQLTLEVVEAIKGASFRQQVDPSVFANPAVAAHHAQRQQAEGGRPAGRAPQGGGQRFPQSPKPQDGQDGPAGPSGAANKRRRRRGGGRGPKPQGGPGAPAGDNA